MLKHGILIFVGLAALAAAPWALAEDAGTMPASLKPWKYEEYTQRYYLKVEAPGEAGAAGLHSEAVMFASVALPLKLTGEGAAARTERIALIGEDGVLQPVYARPVAGSSDSEIVFQTYQGMRRFCLYAAASKPPAAISPPSLRPVPMLVHLRGVTATPGFLTI